MTIIMIYTNATIHQKFNVINSVVSAINTIIISKISEIVSHWK